MQWPRALYDHEEIPPPHCWEEVKQSISKEPLALGQSLHEWEAEPPADAWNQLVARIQEPTSTPRIPAARSITSRPLVGYAAALAGLLLLGSVLWYAFNDRENGLNVRDLAAGLSYADSQAKPRPVQDAVKARVEPETNEISRQTSPTPDTGAEQVLSSSVKRPSVKPREQWPTAVPVVSVSYADGNYIQLTEPDGDVTRVSYKLDSMVRAMHTLKGKPNGAQRREWNRTLETWTARMAESTYIPTGSNFFDIAEFVEFLNNGR